MELTQRRIEAWARALLAHATELGLMPLSEQEYVFAKRLCERGMPAEYAAARVALTRRNAAALSA